MKLYTPGRYLICIAPGLNEADRSCVVFMVLQVLSSSPEELWVRNLLTDSEFTITDDTNWLLYPTLHSAVKGIFKLLSQEMKNEEVQDNRVA